MTKIVVWTIEEFVSYMVKNIKENRAFSVKFSDDFTTNAIGPKCYQAKFPVRIFDEPNGMLAIGRFGSDRTKTFEISNTTLANDVFVQSVRFYFVYNVVNRQVMVELTDDFGKEV